MIPVFLLRPPVRVDLAQASPMGRRIARPRLLRRQAYTLVSVLVIITVLTGLLGITGSLIHALVRAERSCRDQIDHNRAVFRLSSQFRRDVHAALEAQLQKNAGTNPLLQLQMPGGTTIHYQPDAAGIVRLVHSGSKRIHRETYPIGTLSDMQWQAGQVQGQGVLELFVARMAKTSGPTAESESPLRVVAVVGLDHRFSSNGRL